jgi:hypothetical protein
MDYRPATRYRSLSMAAGGGYDNKGPTLIDGLDVVDEQVVVLSPLDVEHRRKTSGRQRRGELGEVRHGMG